MKVNCLLLGARRRVYFLKRLKAELSARYEEYSILYSDSDRLDPLCSYADEVVLLPESSSPNYKEALINILEEKEVTLIFPWNDREILIVNEARKEIEKLGAKVVLPPSDIVELFNDKFMTSDWASKLRISYPKTWKWEVKNSVGLNENFTFPVIIKPRFGQGSLGVFKVESMKELQLFFKNCNEDYLIQEFIDGEEYTVDIFQNGKGCDFIVPRKRIKVRGGECLISKVVLDPSLLKFVSNIVGMLSFKSIYNLQLIVGKEKIVLIEFNPRFGGGSDLTIQAGGNIPALILDTYLESSLLRDRACEIKDGMTMTRYLAPKFIYE